MSKAANPTLIGAFVIGAIILLAGGAMVFGGAELLRPKDRLVAYFPNTVKGLRVGANVLFRGVRIGFVEDIQLQGDVDTFDTLVQVTMQTLPDQFELIRGGERVRESDLEYQIEAEDYVANGVRAQLGVESFVTGQLVVELDFFPDHDPVFRGGDRVEFPEIPTIPNNIQQIVENVQRFLADLQESVDINDMGRSLQSALEGLDELANSEDLRGALAGANALINSDDTQQLSGRLDATLTDASEALVAVRRLAANADSRLAPVIAELEPAIGQLEDTLTEARNALRSASTQIRGDTELGYQLVGTLREVQEAARGLRVFLDLLDRHPEALLRGKREP